jgi:hypothetical protein
VTALAAKLLAAARRRGFSVYRLFSEMCDETWQPNLAETSSVGR